MQMLRCHRENKRTISRTAGLLHNVAVKRCDALMNQDQSIRVALHKQTDITKKQNRIRLNTSVESARYLVHQGLAFRGNDESEESKNKGNFKELL
jgi:hypothetical protein